VFEAGGTFTSSTIYTGAGNDTLLFRGTVSNSTVGTGSGNDSLTFNGTVFNSSIQTDSGNDSVTFNAGFSGGSIDLGIGADTLVFGAGSYTNFTINLGTSNSGADGDIDRVQFANLNDNQNVKIVGANDGDILVIGSGSFAGTYTYDNGFFSNGSDTLTWLNP